MTIETRSPELRLAAERRQEMIGALGLLDGKGDPEFTILTALAKRAFGVPVAVYSLLDARHHWVRASCGLSLDTIPLEHSFCARVVEEEEMVVIEDMSLDPLLAANPFVMGEAGMRFYAGTPIRARDGTQPAGVAVGTLCILDTVPRRFDAEERGTLRNLARIAEALIAARATALHAERLAEERRRDLDTLQRERRRLQQAERMGDMGSWRATAEHGLTHWSDGVFAIHQRPVGALPDIEAALSHYPPADRARLEAAMGETLKTGLPFDIEADFVTAKGRWLRVRILGEPEIRDGVQTAIVGVSQDITVRHRLEQSLRRVAAVDDLTQLPNRAECNRALDAAMATARAEGRDLALLLVDLDGFKAVNDRCGHLVGDDLLRRVADVLRAPARAGCFAARLGGDEFVLVASSPGDRAAFDALVEGLLADLRIAVEHGQERISVSGTIGIAWLDDEVEDRSEFLRRADTALYAAKAHRRGTARTFRTKRRPAARSLAG